MTPQSGDPRSTQLLMKIALVSPDQEESSAAVESLRERGTREVLLAAAALINSDGSKDRFIGASILGQFGTDGHEFAQERFEILDAMIRSESDPAVLGRAAASLGEMRDGRAVPILAGLRTHPHPDVRYGVVWGLLAYPSAEAVNALIELSADEDEDVRDWATFGLGSQIDLDTPEIRDALFARAGDGHVETRGEALVGLARRHDPRAVKLIAERLESGPVGLLELEASAESGDATLLPLLLKVHDAGGDLAEGLDEAIRACGGTLTS